MQCKNLTGDVSGSVFHIFGRDSGVELPISDPDAIFDPSDADHIYSAKVMLMALPPPEELLQKTCQLGESSKLFLNYTHMILYQPLQYLICRPIYDTY